jgi:hypothetical protein
LCNLVALFLEFFYLDPRKDDDERDDDADDGNRDDIGGTRNIELDINSPLKCYFSSR